MKITKMLTILATAGISGALLIGSAPAVSATTVITLPKLTVKAKTYVIKPALKLPRGAVVLTAKVTVKKGTRVIARNKSAVPVRRGTYVATTVGTYKVKISKVVTTTTTTPVSTPVTTTVETPETVWSVLCTPDASPVIKTDYSTYYPGGLYTTPWLAGPVIFTYTGRCGGTDSKGQTHIWNASWDDNDYVFVDPAVAPGELGYTEQIVADAYYKVGSTHYLYTQSTVVQIPSTVTTYTVTNTVTTSSQTITSWSKPITQVTRRVIVVR